MDPIVNKIKLQAENLFGRFIEMRRYFHQYPELSFEEESTSMTIQNILTDANIEFKSGYCKHGIVGTLKGKNPESRIIALRADMDALPIQETSECSYKSKNEGVMHACGHDIHMTCLLGALLILNNIKDQWEGTIKFIFQPGEEKLPGGASVMIKEGALENPKPGLIIGQHVQPGMPVGTIGLNSGAFMASSDEIYITVKGKGGHAAQAHLCVDPILVSSYLIQAFQSLISREYPAIQPAVLSFGTINTTGGATNIIPDELKLSGTFRSFNEEWRMHMHQRIISMTESICKAHNASCIIEIKRGYPCLINDLESSNRFIRFSKAYLGEEQVKIMEPRLSSEDFAYYSQQMPAVFYRLGVGDGPGVHTSQFDIDESALKIGSGLMAYAAISL